MTFAAPPAPWPAPSPSSAPASPDVPPSPEFAPGVERRSTRLIAGLAIAAIWATTMLHAALARSVQTRSNAWHQYFWSNTDESAFAANTGTDRVVLLGRITVTLAVCTALLLVCWTAAVGKNAKRVGIAEVRPIHSAAKWLRPITGIYRAIADLEFVTSAFGGSKQRLVHWRNLCQVNFWTVLILEIVVIMSFRGGIDPSTTGAALDRQVLVRYLMAALTTVTAVLATRAILYTDRVVSDLDPPVGEPITPDRQRTATVRASGPFLPSPTS